MIKKLGFFFLFAAFTVISFVMMVLMSRPSDTYAGQALDPEMVKIIQQDHFLVQAIITYIDECQKKGALPILQPAKEEEKK